MTDIYSLPCELIIEILLNTDGITLGKCRRVCKKWMETIDNLDGLWERMCRQEFEYSSQIAKQKSGTDCKWYHIYRNLHMWINVTSYEKNLRQFYNFGHSDNSHALDIDYGVLPLKDTRGVVLYDMHALKFIPVAVPEKSCCRIANNDHTTVILLKSCLLLQRSVSDSTYMSEAFFKADNFILNEDSLYFFVNRDVYKCDLTLKNLQSKLIFQCNYDIRQIRHFNGNISIFTVCGRIVNICIDGNITDETLSCPPEWINQIKYIHAINHQNFVCYSSSLFKIETDKYQHLYLDFPRITALFFYGEFVLIGTRAGEILLYRLSSQKRAVKPIFEKLAKLPDHTFAIHLDVCERKCGPVIVAATFYDIIILEIDFFPEEKETHTRFLANKIHMYRRMFRLKDRLRLGMPSFKSLA